MKLKEKDLITEAVREGAYIGLVKAYGPSALLTINSPEVIDEIANAIMARIEQVVEFPKNIVVGSN